MSVLFDPIQTEFLCSKQPGDFFGEGALLFDNAKRSATVKAAGLVKLLCLQKEAFDRYLLSYPQHKDKIMGVLGQRMDKNIKVCFSFFAIAWSSQSAQF